MHSSPQDKADAGASDGTRQKYRERHGADHHDKEQDGAPAIGRLLQVFAQHLNEAVHHVDET